MIPLRDLEQRQGNLIAWAMTQGYDPDHTYVGNMPKPPEVILPEGYLSPNFRANEFRCNHCGELHPSGVMPPRQLLDWLEEIRAHFGKPIHINSGYRCPVHNDNVGGVRNSRHLAGDAADFYINGVTTASIYEFCDTLIGSKGGVGLYNTFVHIDARGERARWRK